MTLPSKGKKVSEYTPEEVYTVGINPARTGLGRYRPRLSVEDWVYNVVTAAATYGLVQVLTDVINVLRMTAKRWRSKAPEKRNAGTEPITYWGKPVPATSIRFDGSAEDCGRICVLCPLCCGIGRYKAIIPTKHWVRACVTELNTNGVERGLVDILTVLRYVVGVPGKQPRSRLPERRSTLLYFDTANIVATSMGLRSRQHRRSRHKPQ